MLARKAGPKAEEPMFLSMTAGNIRVSRADFKEASLADYTATREDEEAVALIPDPVFYTESSI